MPQLDIITFSIQIAALFGFSWGSFLVVVRYILPQYLVTIILRHTLWTYLQSISVRIKFYVNLTYLNLVSSETKQKKIFQAFFSFFKQKKAFFSSVYLKVILKKTLLLRQKLAYHLIFVFDTNLLKKICLGNNFTCTSKVIYLFSQRYSTFFLKDKKKKKVIVNEVKKAWAWDEILALTNLPELKKQRISLTSIYKNV